MKSDNYSNKRFSGAILLCLFFVLPFYAQESIKLVILHTNDTHSQVEPTNAAAKPPDMGGYARRMGIIDQIRDEEPNVLLFDAGDYWQGTPYFNIYNGRIEIDAMNKMRYDAATIGNHEFDNGIDTAVVVLSAARFPIVCANYDVENTPLADIIKPFVVIERMGLRIGIFGLSVNPEGLIIESNYKGIRYIDPVKTANEVSKHLKKKEKCDLVICLSHLGAADDFELAKSSRYIDIIIGGHSHTLLEDNTTIANKNGKNVIISQMGKSGLYLGRIDLLLKKK